MFLANGLSVLFGPFLMLLNCPPESPILRSLQKLSLLLRRVHTGPGGQLSAGLQNLPQPSHLPARGEGPRLLLQAGRHCEVGSRSQGRILVLRS